MTDFFKDSFPFLPDFPIPFFSSLFFLHRRVLFLDVSRLGNFFFVSVRKDGMRRVSQRKLGLLYKFRSFFPVACLLLFCFLLQVYRSRGYIYIYSKYHSFFLKILHLSNIKFLFEICKKILKRKKNYFNL